MSEDVTKRDALSEAETKPVAPSAGVKKRGVWIDLAVVAVALAVGLAFWNFELRWRPKTLTKDAAEIAKLVESAGWVSPGVSKDKAVYLIAYRECPACDRYVAEEFPKLQKAGIDTRVILFTRRDKTDPAERSGVAELWSKRDWATYQYWMSRPADQWKATDIPVADDWYGRTLLIAQGRAMVDRMQVLLSDNGMKMGFPTLIWRDAKGRLRGCACTSPDTYKYVRRDLGVVE